MKENTRMRKGYSSFLKTNTGNILAVSVIIQDEIWLWIVPLTVKIYMKMWRNLSRENSGELYNLTVL